MRAMKSIRLLPGKERSLLRCHPWVFEGSIARGKADPGETVRVESADGSFLAWGAYSPNSRIRVRAWSFIEAERIDRAFFERRVQRAVAETAVQQCWRVSPGPDFVLVVHGAGMAAYHALVQRLFTQDANVRNVKAFFSVKRAKFDPRLDLSALRPTSGSPGP